MKSWNDLTLDELYSFLKLRCDVFMWEQKADDAEMVTEATFTFVALDDEGRPRPVK